jgi:hypothetical protein
MKNTAQFVGFTGVDSCVIVPGLLTDYDCLAHFVRSVRSLFGEVAAGSADFNYFVHTYLIRLFIEKL